MKKKNTLKKVKRLHILCLFIFLVIALIPVHRRVRRMFEANLQRISGKKTVNDRVEQFSQQVRKRLQPEFDRINMSYPPQAIVMIGLKLERQLEIWVSDDNKTYNYLKSYPILGASGNSGPKLKEGDCQVPEGIYHIESLNPNSLFHLSLRLNYPNDFDKQMGQKDGRTNLGSDIMIHGNTCSVGCLALGDQAAEDLFILAAETGIDNVKVILSPLDFRVIKMVSNSSKTPEWLDELYSAIKSEIAKFR
jgi:murein L,D-transpeptidase YafK